MTDQARWTGGAPAPFTHDSFLSEPAPSEPDAPQTGQVTLTLGAAGPPGGSYGPSAWCCALATVKQGEGGVTRYVKHWRGLLPRSTAERAREHALIEGLSRLKALTPLVVHGDAPRGAGLKDAAAALLAHRPATWADGPVMDADARAMLSGLPAQPGRQVQPVHDAWVPVRLHGAGLRFALTWTHLGPQRGRANLIELTGDAAPVISTELTYPCLAPTFRFCPDGTDYPGAWLREVQRPHALPGGLQSSEQHGLFSAPEGA